VTVLKGYVELIYYFLEGNQDENISEAIEIVTETMNELISIVEQMHDISSFDHGKKRLTTGDIEIKKLLELIYKEMKVLFSKRKIYFKWEYEGPSAFVKGDETQVKRSIRELLQNALKFTPEGGEVLLQAVSNVENKKVYIKVKDNGIGIPSDKLDLIFEPFYEVQNVINHMTSKTEFMGGGIGLGLTLAKEVVESHKGTLLLESEENKGSTFTVVLPYEKIQKENKVVDANIA
jgi:signal transduction histidine kinase